MARAGSSSSPSWLKRPSMGRITLQRPTPIQVGSQIIRCDDSPACVPRNRRIDHRSPEMESALVKVQALARRKIANTQIAKRVSIAAASVQDRFRPTLRKRSTKEGMDEDADYLDWWKGPDKASLQLSGPCHVRTQRHTMLTTLCCNKGGAPPPCSRLQTQSSQSASHPTTS